MSVANITLRALFEAGVHFGHLTRFRDPAMSEYIYGSRNRINIINLEKTLPLFRDALKFVNRIASKNGGRILFVGTKRTAQQLVATYAQKCDMPYINYRWLGGMLTNYKTIKQSIRRLKELENMRQDGTLQHLTKKEGLTLMREMTKLERALGGIKQMGGLPDALFVIDVGYEKIAISEAKRLGIPVIGIVDTNSNTKDIDFPVPGNDDAMSAIELYLRTISETILAAKQTDVGRPVLSEESGLDADEALPASVEE